MIYNVAHLSLPHNLSSCVEVECHGAEKGSNPTDAVVAESGLTISSNSVSTGDPRDWSATGGEGKFAG